MVILSNKQFKSLNNRLDTLERMFRLQGEAHSTIMNQEAATQQLVGDGFKQLHERISFALRPKR